MKSIGKMDSIRNEIKKFLEEERRTINYLSRFCVTSQAQIDRIAKGKEGGTNPGIDTIMDIRQGIKKASRRKGTLTMEEENIMIKWLMAKIDDLEKENKRLGRKIEDLMDQIAERRQNFAQEGGGKTMVNNH